MDLKNHIKEVENFPIDGISFKDITTILNNPEAYKFVIDEIIKFAKEKEADVILGPEARGFIFGCPVAYGLGVGFVPARKPGKLPREMITQKYGLEYGENILAIHKGDIKVGQKVVIVDDLLATGGTLEACTKLIEESGAEVVGIANVIELTDLNAREKLKKYELFELVKY